MNTAELRARLRLVGTSVLVAGGLAIGGFAAAAAQQDEGSALIDAEVIADIEVVGGDAQGGDAQGGDAGLSASIAGTGSEGGGGGGTVYVAQEGGILEGGEAVGGDAQGGDGLNAFVDAVLVVDAEVNLDVAADVAADIAVDANADANLPNLPNVPNVGLQSAAQPVGTDGIDVPEVNFDGLAGTVGGGLTDDLGGTLGGVTDTGGGLTDNLGGTLGGVNGTGRGLTDTAGGATNSLSDSLSGLGGLGGVQLLDLLVDADLFVAGGDAAGGDAAGGNALIQAAVAGTEGGGVVKLEQEAGVVYGGDATGGIGTGGDGIELDVILDADVDLVVDATVDLAVDLDADANADVGVGARPARAAQPAQLGRFETLD